MACNVIWMDYHQNVPATTGRFDRMIADVEAEIDALLGYPDADLVRIIREVGFSCTCCGRCCTREFNDHVFLLDSDTEKVRAIDPSALMPAPYFEFCDQNGNFYVSGYALRTREDGACVFLSEERRCTIYDRRMAICRVYPYMLHREEGEDGTVDWRQISGLNQHGEYYAAIGEEEAREIACEVKAYEEAYLRQEVAFLQCLRDYFAANGLRHIQKVYDRQMAAFRKGAPLPVRVYCGGAFEEMTAVCGDYGATPRMAGKVRRV
jgi:Fe-S-cluster containining protein